jgi:hypothetical protein
MGRVEEEHSPAEAGYSLRMPPDVAYLLVVGVPGWSQELSTPTPNSRIPFGSPFGSHYPAGGG